MFIEDVQRWLANPPKAEEAPLPALPEGFDLEGRWEVVWRTLEGMEDDQSPGGQHRWKNAHASWTTPGRLERWLAAFVCAFHAGVGRRLPTSDHGQAIDDALVASMLGFRLGQARRTRTQTLELQRLADLATAQTEPHLQMNGSAEIAEWCVQNAVCSSTHAPTHLGRVLSDLRGRDAVELALAVGAELSIGPMDPWRLGIGGLLALGSEAQAYDHDLLELRPEAISRYHRTAIARLAEMGIAEHLTDDEDPYYDRFQIQPDAKDLVLRVATEPDSRFRALARALLDLERGRLSAEATGRGGPDLSDMSYARSVAHEIRNLTLPLSTGLTALWEELGQDQPDHVRRQKLRDRITRSLDRLNEFATEAVKLSAAVAEEEIALTEVVAEAIKATEAERNGRISVEATRIDTRKILGTRRDWSTALINLLRNATQARAGKGTVLIHTLTDDAGGLHLYVDDDGPGVPEELRERIFDFGHSTHGGSGLGLADARRTAQRSGGTLVCEASPQGGARFHLTLPRRSTA